MNGALHGIKIIEVSQVLAAPFCGYQFALLGADVIKVEIPDLPDCARGRGPLSTLNDKGVGLTYQVQASNKKSLALDIRTERGREALLHIVKDADVFIENYATGTLQNLGLGYDDIKTHNPKIIYCAMTGYGDEGPKASKGAYDNTIQAASGTVAQCNGVKPGLSFVDYAAGYSAAFAIAAALLQRQRTGEGCYISASMLEVALSLMAPEAAAKQVAPDAPKRFEAGLQTYETAEGTLVLGAFKPSQYRKLGTCFKDLGYDIPLLADIQTWEDVWMHSDTMRSEMSEVLMQKSAATWQKHFELSDIPAERVATLEEAVSTNQTLARGYFKPSPIDADITLPLAAYHMSQGGPELTIAPPVLGQHSRNILESAGLSPAEIDRLFAEGVVV